MNGMRLFSIMIAAVAATAPVAAQVNYDTQIQPIFNANCIGCHGGTSGVTLSSYEAAIASVGVQYGINVIQPGNSAASPIVDKISNAQPLHGQRMPRGGTPLSATQIALIKTWIDEGAKSQATAVVPQKLTGVPERFALAQNYPNPFNPSTTIQFSIPVRQIVRLKVFDVIGHEVAVLMNGPLEAGTYSIGWNASRVASGMYFYQIQTSDPSGGSGTMYMETRKLIVQK